MLSIGTWNMAAALASYILPVVANTSMRQVSPATHAMTRASMAEKSLMMKRWPGAGTRAVRISWLSTSGTSPKSSSTVSLSPAFTRLRARSRSCR